MTVQIYKSTDASAPTLSGTVGDLINLLDKCLVAGYGAKAAAGWTKPFTGTNKAVFRNSTSTGTGFYLNVNDAAPSSATDARVIGYEAMTAQDVGTNPFPTSAQAINGIFIRKSSTANATTRAWVVLADETVFYLFIETGEWAGTDRAFSSFMFGDFYSYVVSDAYRCGISARTTEGSTSVNSSVDTFSQLAGAPASSGGVLGTAVTSMYVARGYASIGGSILAGKHTDNARGDQASMGVLTGTTGGLLYPNPADNGLWLAPVYIHHNLGVRGYLKGIWVALANQPLNHGDTFNGTGSMSSKSFLVHASYSGTNNISGRCMLETSNTWS